MEYRGEPFEQGGGEILFFIVPAALLIAIGLVAYGWIRHRETMTLWAFAQLVGQLIFGLLMGGVVVGTVGFFSMVPAFLAAALVAFFFSISMRLPFTEVMGMYGHATFLTVFATTWLLALIWWLQRRKTKTLR